MGVIKHIPEIGKVYGQWTVISTTVKRHSMKNNRTSYFKVRCACGREGWRAVHTLVNNITKSCKSCCKNPQNTNTIINSHFNRIKRRAVVSEFEFNLTANYIEELFERQNRKCALSGLDICFRPNFSKNQQTASLDRIDNKKGYIIGNVQWVHKDINFMKGVLDQNKFIELCSLISSKCS